MSGNRNEALLMHGVGDGEDREALVILSSEVVEGCPVVYVREVCGVRRGAEELEEELRDDGALFVGGSARGAAEEVEGRGSV